MKTKTISAAVAAILTAQVASASAPAVNAPSSKVAPQPVAVEAPVADQSVVIAPEAPRSVFGGFYVGIGAAHASHKVSETFVTQGNNITREGKKGTLSGAQFALLMGFGKTLSNNFFLGGEFDATLGTLKKKYDNNEIRSQNNFGLHARVGYVVAPSTMLHGLIGFQFLNTQFKYNYPALKGEHKSTKGAFSLGLGAEQRINKFGVRLDLLHAFPTNVAEDKFLRKDVKVSRTTVRILGTYNF